jgi:hypothetical protein
LDLELFEVFAVVAESWLMDQRRDEGFGYQFDTVVSSSWGPAELASLMFRLFGAVKGWLFVF